MPADVAFGTPEQTETGLMAAGQIGETLGKQFAGLPAMGHELALQHSPVRQVEDPQAPLQRRARIIDDPQTLGHTTPATLGTARRLQSLLQYLPLQLRCRALQLLKWPIGHGIARQDGKQNRSSQTLEHARVLTVCPTSARLAKGSAAEPEPLCLD